MTKLASADKVRHFQTAADWLLSAIIDQSADCLQLISLDGVLEYVNRAGRCAMGIKDFSDAAGKQWVSLWPAEAQSLVAEHVKRALAGESVRFEARAPDASQQPHWWDVSLGPVYDPDGKMRGLVSVSRDITPLVAAREAAEAISAEMAHRLRNSYAVTSALLCASARGDPALEAFAQQVAEQFMHLGAAQTLMLSGGNSTVSLESLITELTRGFTGDRSHIEIGEVPHLLLEDRKVQPLALTIGELCTNSAKYGAIGHGGAVTISCGHEEGQLSLHWSEQSNRPVARHARSGGSGFDLIRRVLAAQKGGLEVTWREDGLDAVVSIGVD
jgi:PAS domain S-box-containing protein